ncbi:MAG TPA: MBL fold metallo-hydrolase [Pseudogracilibacillus sp.]|nr:MBL fold metallo-hydrolase [Pseudogracilibacillus sp.]
MTNRLKVHPIIIPTSLGKLETINFYLVERDDELILIDAGENRDTHFQALINKLKELNKDLSDLKAILLTHHHSDHTGLVNRIRSKVELPVFAHKRAGVRLKRDEAYFKRRIHFFKNLYDKHGCGEKGAERVLQLEQSFEKGKDDALAGPLTYFNDGDFLYGFKVISVPGHSPDQVIFYDEREKVAFVGDHFIKHSPSNAIYDLLEDGSTFHSLMVYEQSLKKLLNIDIRLAYAGHGEAITDVKDILNHKLDRIEQKGRRILGELTEAMTAMQLAEKMYQGRLNSPILFALIMSELIGHLERLEHFDFVKKLSVRDMLMYERMK